MVVVDNEEVDSERRLSQLLNGPPGSAFSLIVVKREHAARWSEGWSLEDEHVKVVEGVRDAWDPSRPPLFRNCIGLDLRERREIISNASESARLKSAEADAQEAASATLPGDLAY